MKTIVMGCDNAAVGLKNIIKSLVQDLGYITEDLGVYSSEEGTYYPDVAKEVCQNIIDSNYQKLGILICGTGIGMSISANKFSGIRASVCHDNYSAERSKLSNNCNVLCMGARVVGPELAKKITKEWLSLDFKDGSSTPKIEAIKKIERENIR